MALQNPEPREKQMNLNTVLISIVMGLGVWGLHSLNEAQTDIAAIKTYEQAEKERTDGLVRDMHDYEQRIHDLEVLPHGPPFRRGAEGSN